MEIILVPLSNISSQLLITPGYVYVYMYVYLDLAVAMVNLSNQWTNVSGQIQANICDPMTGCI